MSCGKNDKYYNRTIRFENRVKIKRNDNLYEKALYLVVGYMKRYIKYLENVINTINWIQFKFDL